MRRTQTRDVQIRNDDHPAWCRVIEAHSREDCSKEAQPIHDGRSWCERCGIRHKPGEH